MSRTPRAAARLRELFTATLGRPPAGVWSAPGRVNLIGEHTDYNAGFVLPYAIAAGCRAALGPATGPTTVRSVQRPGDRVEIALADAVPGRVPGWAAYVVGVLWALRRSGLAVPDVDVVVDSDVPLGSGLSSSAALECAVALAVNDLLGARSTRTRLALAAQRAENEFAGIPCGVMDQLASMHGRAGHLVHLDARTLHVAHIPFAPGAHGLAVLVLDTRTPRSLADGAYAERRLACESAARILGLDALRDLDPAGLPAALARLGDPVLRRRTRHVVTENARVEQVVAHLAAGADPRGIGPALTASHASLRDDFEVSVPPLDVAVDTALAAGAYGARMTGGGFGGSVLVLLEAAAVEDTVSAIAGAYARRGWAAPGATLTAPGQGAARVL